MPPGDLRVPYVRYPDHGRTAMPPIFAATQPLDFGDGITLSPLVLSILEAKLVGPNAEILTNVLDRETGAPLRITFIDPLRGETPRERLNAIREMLIAIATHEIDECLMVRGERVFDPHKIRSFESNVR